MTGSGLAKQHLYKLFPGEAAAGHLFQPGAELAGGLAGVAAVVPPPGPGLPLRPHQPRARGLLRGPALHARRGRHHLQRHDRGHRGPARRGVHPGQARGPAPEPAAAYRERVQVEPEGDGAAAAVGHPASASPVYQGYSHGPGQQHCSAAS